MLLLLLVLHSCLALAEKFDSEAVIVPGSSIRYTQNKDSCEKIAALDMVCDSLGLDIDQKNKARNLVELLPATTFIDDCDRKRSRLKKCLDEK